ncbi:MAG: tRNA-specific 2-thiouridylase [Parcubacteria group bacterium Gr01-1014_3]|nr:MAG: tRNA-specific 2-thiouridylase [Parcubacteria group bacterium Gr01-1014_3]
MKKNSKQKIVYPERLVVSVAEPSRRVFVGMSGGVDSSVAAALLKKEGYDVVGVHLKCFNVDGCAAEDAEDARRAAEHLNIPFYAFDYEQEYKDLVVKYMVDGYKKGITPNPDVMCNKEIKFGLFYKKALEMGADFVATGHYALLRELKVPSSKLKVRMIAIAKDKNKDQSYFLWTLKPEQLKHCLFPVGDYTKPQVRKLAEKFGLHNATKKDSQGICFLGQVSLPDFLAKYIKPKKGAILDIHGNEIGEHHGAHFYTIGQRHGLGVGGSDKPLYVASKDIKKNIVVVAEGEDNPALYRKEVVLTDVNLFFEPLSLRGAKRRGNLTAIPVSARVRYRQPLQPAVLTLNFKLKTGELKFHRPMKFVAPGQSAVFYDKKGTMLGGGIIK